MSRRRGYLGWALAAAVLTLTVAGWPASNSGGARSTDNRLDLSINGPETSTPTGNSPDDVLTYYSFPGYPNKVSDAKGTNVSGTGEVIAILGALDDPYIYADVSRFDTAYTLAPLNGLGSTPCTIGDNYGGTGCFQVVYATGKKTKKTVTEGREQEDASDVEWAHAAAPGADIVLIEAPTADTAGDIAAIKKAIALDVDVVSMSFTDPNLASAGADSLFENASGTGFLAAVGEHTAKNGEECPTTFYPAGSPYVVAVGGTEIQSGSEIAWVKDLGGVENGSHDSTAVDRPSYQLGWDTAPYRDLPDVALSAEDYSTYVSLPKPGWVESDGTSLSTPVWAGLVAEADQMRVALGHGELAGEGLLDGLYLAAGSHESHQDTIDPAFFKDITYGGTTGGGCSAKEGFDIVTGLGTPQAASLIQYLADDL